jgi:hypothetical protein
MAIAGEFVQKTVDGKFNVDYNMTFEVLTMIAVFWDVKPYSLVDS